MENLYRGWGSRLVFICIIFMTVSQRCVGGENLTTVSCSEQERQALVKFKHSVRDENEMLSSWGVGKDCCEWERVGCDDATGRVISLHLRRNAPVDQNYYVSLENDVIFENNEDYLVGDEVNSCLKELVNLEHLDLSGNHFQQSRIPKFIGSLKQLRYLNFSNAGFHASIPHQIGNLSNLKVLDLSSSTYRQELMTDDMSWVYGLSKLKHLDLSGVDLGKARNLDNLLYMIPFLLKLRLSTCGLSMAHLGQHHLNSSRGVVSIKHLDLSGNGFKGHLPGLFLNTTSLVFLDFSYNDLSMSGSFEKLLNMIPSVSELHLSGCGFQKVTLSPTNLNFSTHNNIQHLDLSLNEIEDIIPFVLANMSSLLSLDLSFNSLSSSIPLMPNLLKLDISRNNFRQIENVGIWRQCGLKELIASGNILEGEMIGISSNVSECSQYALEILYLDQNTLNCSIPEALGRFTNLRGLNLSLNQLTGPIPKALGKLRSLQELDLSYNHLNSSIPKSLGRLTALTQMFLMSNQITGPIPVSLGRLTNLRALDLLLNELTGPIPKALGKLRSLQQLDLSYNQLSGYIPESLGRLTALRYMFLSSNRFTGSIPVSLGRLTSLRVLLMSSNLLNGSIPSSIGKLTELYLIDVSNNSLQGVVSEYHFANLSMLKYLNANYNNKLIFNISREWIPPFQLIVVRLSSCKIEDGFPQWLRTQRKLDELVLSNTSIYGSLPTWLRHMPIIRILDLSHNKLTDPLKNLPSVYEVRDEDGILLLQDNLFRGLIPRWLCTWTNLQVLDLSKNRLTGKIPKCLWNMFPLYVMMLGSKKLSGVISSSLGSPSLIFLQLSDNNFNGELPRDVGHFINLEFLDLGENKISGNIPEWIGENMTKLTALRLHKNNFTGTIPHSLCKSRLQLLDLAHNNLTGSIPHCFGDLDGLKKDFAFQSDNRYDHMIQVYKGVELDYTRKTLQLVRNMDLSNNKLVGDIPEALTTLELLMGLNLSYNHFTGGIPKNIGNMKSLSSLDLSANELTGMIPPSMADLNFLSYLNLSHNNLSGRIPTGSQLQTLIDPSIYAYNPYLFGAPLPKECTPHENPQTTSSKKQHENGKGPNKVWFYLDIMSGFATGFWGIIGVLLFKKQWRHKLFMFCEETMDTIYVAVTIRVLKIKRGFNIFK